ncbi:putative phosphatase [Rubrobacter radiotolerans]|uniref:HAD hydrolase-like protein n=1 Tax=Rubrobacter radiotolerans TaxID=42256 RepID=A0A023X188_RUBRA|nr:HAD hydrolase-like protein [Rubrobacter radiotolerans]AHY45785.1 putative phosphatase [Rubrobacter radiotolerans]MDX5893200.1 HAD hydrolase-like protein [Rubrobacter radiotolerans]SMC03255.1 pyrophosphatase PpaX [Rubrobacter radiotolerans DSM 5868]
MAKRREPLQVALFDFDGTLVDTTELIFQSMRHATTEVLRKELSREVLLANVGQPLPKQMEVFDPERVDDLLESYRTYNDEVHETYIKSFPEIPASITRLKEAGVRVAVVTSKRRHSVNLAIKSFPELGEVVDHFVTMEDTERHKPDPEPLLEGLRVLGGSSPAAAAYTGDAPFDVAAARAAGMTSVAVSWGAFTEKTLRASEPDFLAGDISGAVDYLLTLV